MIPWLTRISRRVHGRVGFLQRPIAGDENWFKSGSWPRVPGAHRLDRRREHPRPPLDCQLFPDGWLIAGGGDPNRFPAPDSRWRAGAPQQVRHPFVLPSDGHVHGVERPHLRVVPDFG